MLRISFKDISKNNSKKIMKRIPDMIQKSIKGNITHNHAATADGIPIFINYMRPFIRGVKVGSVHAEMAVINYLLSKHFSSSCNVYRQCIL